MTRQHLRIVASLTVALVGSCLCVSAKGPTVTTDTGIEPIQAQVQRAGKEVPRAERAVNTSAPTHAQSFDVPPQPESLIDRFLRTADTDDPDGVLYMQAIEHLERDAAARARTLAALRERLPRDDCRRRLRLLAAVHTPDILDAALQLSRDSAPEPRRDGYALMQLSATELARDTLAHAIATEADPEALASAIQSFQAQLSVPEETAARLQALTKHPAESVRAAAVATLSGIPGRAADTLMRSLADSSHEVAAAALSSLGSENAESPELTSELLGVATDVQAPLSLRSEAANALLDRDLPADDMALIQRFKSTLEAAAP